MLLLQEVSSTSANPWCLLAHPGCGVPQSWAAKLRSSFVCFSQRLVWEVDVSYAFRLWAAARKGSSAAVLQPDWCVPPAFSMPQMQQLSVAAG